MEFGFSEEQQELAVDGALAAGQARRQRRRARRRSSPRPATTSRCGRRSASRSASPRSAIPEEYDGAGFSLFESMVALEEVGRSLAPSPLLASLVTAEALLAGADEDARQRLLPRIAAGEVAAFALERRPGALRRPRHRAARGPRTTTCWSSTRRRATPKWLPSMDQTSRFARHSTPAGGTRIGDGAAARRPGRAGRRGRRGRAPGRPGGARPGDDGRLQQDRGCSSAGRSARSRRSSTGWPTCWCWSRCAARRPGRRRTPSRPTRDNAEQLAHVAKSYCSDALEPDRRRDRAAARRHRDHLGARRPAGLQARARPVPAVRPGARAPGADRALTRVRSEARARARARGRPRRFS